MIGNVVKINFDDMTEAIPAFLTILFMPLAYSISEGITIGVISYVVINVAARQKRRRSAHCCMFLQCCLC